MERSTEIILKAIVANIAKQIDPYPFLMGLSQELFSAVENDLHGDPVTQAEVGKMAEYASRLRDSGHL